MSAIDPTQLQTGDLKTLAAHLEEAQDLFIAVVCDPQDGRDEDFRNALRLIRGVRISLGDSSEGSAES